MSIKSHTVFVKDLIDTFTVTTNFLPSKGDVITVETPDGKEHLCTVDDVFNGSVRLSIVKPTGKRIKLQKKVM